MKAIRQRNDLLAAFTGLGILISVLIFVSVVFMPEIKARMLLPVTVAASGCVAGLWIREYGRFKTARLIVENQILHIRPAVISDSAGDASDLEGKKTSRCTFPTSAFCWAQKSSNSTRKVSALKPWRSGATLSLSLMARIKGCKAPASAPAD